MDQNKLSIGITGSNGFIGSHLTKTLEKTGKYDLVLFNRQKNNLMVKESLKTFVAGRDIIFHIAGANRDTNINICNVNILGTLNLLEAIKLYGYKKVTLIYISSIHIYNPSFSPLAIKEDQQSYPDTIFGISKITAEKLIHFYDLNSIIFRVSNTYGPFSRPFYNSVIATFCHQVTNNKAIQIDGNGEQKRDFIFISDVVDGLIKAIGYNPDRNELFNLGSGQLSSLNTIIETLRTISRKEVKVEYLSNPGKNSGWVITDQQKVCSKLNWKPKINLKEGLKETYLYFQNN